MAEFQVLLTSLRKAEKQFEKQLQSVRDAIAALGSGGTKKTGRKRRQMSAATKAKMAAAQKARWAKKKSS